MRDQRGAEGFTLVEVIVALVILSVVLLGMAGSTALLVRGTTAQRSRADLVAAADARIAEVVAYPNYAGIETAFVGTIRDVPLPGLTQVTEVNYVTTHLTHGSLDYKTVTVTVTGAGIIGSVRRTITIASP